MKKICVFLAMLAMLAACNVKPQSKDYLSREEYLSVRRDWTAEELRPKSFGANAGLLIYDSELFGHIAADSARDGQLILLDGTDATIFLDEDVSHFGYMKEWVVCVINAVEFVVVDSTGKTVYPLFTSANPVNELYCDGEAIHFLAGETLWRYHPWEESPELVIEVPGIESFYLVSNLEYLWYAPDEEYKAFIENAAAAGMDSDEIYFALGQSGLLGTANYYTDIRNDIVYQQPSIDPFNIDQVFEWYEQYRVK